MVRRQCKYIASAAITTVVSDDRLQVVYALHTLHLGPVSHQRGRVANCSQEPSLARTPVVQVESMPTLTELTCSTHLHDRGCGQAWFPGKTCALCRSVGLEGYCFQCSCRYRVSEHVGVHSTCRDSSREGRDSRKIIVIHFFGRCSLAFAAGCGSVVLKDGAVVAFTFLILST